jgi:hypothetical protein
MTGFEHGKDYCFPIEGRSLSWISDVHCLISELAKGKKKSFERKGYFAHVLNSRPSCIHSICLEKSRREFGASKTREPCTITSKGALQKEIV